MVFFSGCHGCGYPLKYGADGVCKLQKLGVDGAVFCRPQLPTALPPKLYIYARVEVWGGNL